MDSAQLPRPRGSWRPSATTARVSPPPNTRAPAVRARMQKAGVALGRVQRKVLGNRALPEALRFSLLLSLVFSVLHERTRAKTLILSNDGRECLQEVLGLERDEIERLLSKNHEDDKEGLAWLPAPPVSTPPVSVS